MYAELTAIGTMLAYNTHGKVRRFLTSFNNGEDRPPNKPGCLNE